MITNRTEFYLKTIFSENPNGLTFEEICDKVAELENKRDESSREDKYSVEIAVCYGLSLEEMKKEETHYYLDKCKPQALVKWELRGNKYFLVGDTNDKTKKEGHSISLKKAFSKYGDNGATLQELRRSYHEELAKANYENPEKIILPKLDLEFFSLMFTLKPAYEYFYPDRIAKPWNSQYTTFTDWEYLDGKYYPQKVIPKESVNRSLENAVRETLAGQIAGYAKLNGLTNTQYLREFALGMSKLKTFGIREENKEYPYENNRTLKSLETNEGMI